MSSDIDATPENWREIIRLNDDGLVPVIVQEATSRDVLMLAWMDVEAVSRTLETKRATYWSRSRQEYWVKGETSGHVQHVRSLALDCDADALLMLVDQTGPYEHPDLLHRKDHQCRLTQRRTRPTCRSDPASTSSEPSAPNTGWYRSTPRYSRTRRPR